MVRRLDGPRNDMRMSRRKSNQAQPASFGSTVNPRAAVIYDPLAGTTLKVIYGSAYPLAPLGDYAIRDWEEKGLPQLSLAYIISAIVGIGVTVLAVLFLGKLLVRKED